MSTGIIVFARMGSTRLPGKVLADIGGRTLLQRVLDRARLVPDAVVIVATSTGPEDDAIASLATAEGVAVFRGSLTDVAGRALAAADEFGLERFARVCADRPFFDPALTARALERSKTSGADLVTTMRSPVGAGKSPVPTVPAGLTTEVIRTEALRRLLATTDDATDREHVTRAFYRIDTRFRHDLLEAEVSPGALPLVIDTEVDLVRARAVTALLGADSHRADIAQVAATMASVVRDS